MDDTDREILRNLQADNQLTSAELGARVGLSVSATHERMRRLRASGAIIADRAIVAPAAVNRAQCAFIFVDVQRCDEEGGIRDAARAMPDVLEIHNIAGPHSFLMKVRVADTLALKHLLSQLKQHQGVLGTETIVVLETEKETSELPVTATP